MAWEGQAVHPKAVDKGEAQRLIREYGQPLHQRVLLEFEDDDLMGWLRGKPRRMEVVLAIRRPNGKLLLHTKAFYPEGVFRLPSGGIERGESIEGALLREAHEETGLEVRVVSFLGVIRYELRSTTEAHTFTSYVFLLDEVDGVLTPDQVGEDITAFREVEPEVLPGIAARLGSLKGGWRDWGLFRAPPHELVARALAGNR